MAQHDEAYKLLFSHPQMVADLLRGFVREDWVAELDFTTLERVNPHFVNELLREREDDIIWRIRWQDRWLYVYLLLEFQSTVDDYMAVRLMAYEGLLYLDLIKEGELNAIGCLPSILPVVLYNGDARWDAALDIADMIQAPAVQLARYHPHLRYLILDRHDYDEATLAPLHNLVAALFRLENSRTPEATGRVLDALIEWLAAPEQDSLRRAFVVWLKQVFLPTRLPGQEVPEFNQLQEARVMLADNTLAWTEQWKQQGMADGEKQEAGKILHRLLKRRFDTIPAWVEERIEQADSLMLEGWIERLLDAKRLEDIFTS